MKRYRILYLFIALALLLAPIAAYAAPTPADFHSTATGAVNPQPPAPVGGANGSRGGAPDATQPMQYTSPASFSEGFDDLILPDWAMQNNSSPVGTSGWFQGNTLVFNSHSGATDSYIGANYVNTSPVGTISNWLMTPQLNLVNGDVLTFWTRTTVNPSAFPDRLQVRLSTAGASTDVGTLATDVGDFTTLLLDINPTLTSTGYPAVWTQYTITLIGLPINASGRFAWRYFVTDGGPSGTSADYIGIDTVEYSGSPLAVTLASFAAEAQADHVLVTWETVSELNNAGFNLYRGSLSEGGDRVLLASVPSQAPGSSQGANYSYADTTVQAGQTYWYWLEDLDLSGAATLHGPVSAIFAAPTAVTFSSLEAGTVAGSALPLAAAVTALLVLWVTGYSLRRRPGRIRG